MRIFRAALVCTILVTAAYARAGGGGSYRSSSGSSSSRSSSSSSSSRSSYSGSSSSSSYRSSGSGSRSSGSSGSYSGASSKTYSSLTDIKSIRRKFDFLTPGRISISERITFTYKGLTSDGHEYTPATPNAPWSFFTSHGYDHKVIQLLEPPKQTFRFKLLNPVTDKDVTLEFKYVVSAAATPTLTGAVYDFFPYCLVTDCVQEFENLPQATRLDFYAATRDNGEPARLLRTRQGTSFSMSLSDFSGTRFFRLELPGAEMQNAAFKAWSAGDVSTQLTTKVKIFPDATLRQETSIHYVKDSAYKQMVALQRPAPGGRYLYRNVSGINYANISDYTDSTFTLENKATTVAYDMLGALTHPASGHETIRLPVVPVIGSTYDVTHTQPEARFLAVHKKIEVQLPPQIRPEVSLWECKKLYQDKCGILRPLKTRVTFSETGLSLIPEEAQVTGLWYLDLKVPQNSFAGPSFMKRMQFAFGHYNAIGNYPKWVFWVYFLALIAGLVGLIWLFIALKRAALRRVQARVHSADESLAIADIKKHDPEFDVDAFKRRGQEIATRIQHAWCAGDMAPVRKFLSQGVYNRFRLQIKIMREYEKRQNAMADFHIREFYVHKHNRSGEYDCLTVRMEAEARDLMLGADKTFAEAMALARGAAKTEFVEYYSFMRRRDAMTHAAHSVDQCSNCGTPFNAEGETNKCKSCGAVMGSGRFDWVLAEITQEAEYQGNRRGKKIAGDLSADRIEDRASFVFWRDIMARLSNEKNYIARDATAEYLESHPSPQRLFDIAVGAAELEGYEDKGDVCYSKVRIKWSAAEAKGSEVRHRESVLAMLAKPENIGGSGFAEHSCTTCGAPLPETDSTSCSYCHSPIQAKNADWLLNGIETSVE